MKSLLPSVRDPISDNLMIRLSKCHLNRRRHNPLLPIIFMFLITKDKKHKMTLNYRMTRLSSLNGRCGLMCLLSMITNLRVNHDNNDGYGDDLKKYLYH